MANQAQPPVGVPENTTGLEGPSRRAPAAGEIISRLFLASGARPQGRLHVAQVTAF